MNADQYLAAVELQLGDLPWKARKHLAADLRLHLAELPPGEDLVERLGSPAAYAAELRSAEGLAVPRGPIAFLRARRPRNVAIALVLVAVVAALIAAAAWASSYQPVVTGSTWMNPRGGRAGALEEYVATFRPGAPFQLGFSIRNDGRFPVRIVDVPLGNFYPFVVRAFVIPPNPHVVDFQTHGEPFHPFTLAPGEERLLALRGRYRTCASYPASAGSAITVFGLPVRERFALWSQTVDVELASPLVIQTTARHACRPAP